MPKRGDPHRIARLLRSGFLPTRHMPAYLETSKSHLSRQPSFFSKQRSQDKHDDDEQDGSGVALVPSLPGVKID